VSSLVIRIITIVTMLLEEIKIIYKLHNFVTFSNKQNKQLLLKFKELMFLYR